ncbi:unnamed protein product [Leptidea sinapis]|uniref:Neurexin-4 n=1 Tax=Leptidea sinapis TaxID=189913 RepID=A0A5E4Q788_9NEOP|nr:unnamed protein product [Leptidea sinapis]
MMNGYLHYFFTLLCCSLPSIKSDSLRYYYDYECNEPLIESAKLSATSSLRERGPDNAKLYGVNAWTASENDFDQQLIIDLGSVKNVTRVATQGRAHSQEFVQEYHISYGSNGLDYVQYKAAGGEVKMFNGNHDGNTVVKNEFEVPIIAQYIRINPMRWRDKISMRVELYGCDYVADTLFFNGSSLVKVDLLRDPVSASREMIRFRFKTSVASGALMYSRGTQGDYIALQLRDNRLVLNMDLGSGTSTSLSVGSLLDDNVWHDVVVSRNRRDLIFSVDRVVVQGRIRGEFSRLNLNRAFYIGGVPNFQEGLVVTQNFTGCVENMYLNATNVISKLKEGYDTGEPFKYQKVNTLYTCPEPPVVPVTFLKESSYAKLRGYSGGTSLNVSLEFRTYEQHGLLIYHKFKTDGYVKVYLEEGKVKVELFTEGSPKVRLDNYAEQYNDGRWHVLMLTMAPDTLTLSLDFRPVRTTKKLRFFTGASYYIAGGKTPPRGFVGCMRRIAVDGNYRLPTDWKRDEYCCPDEVVFDACHMIDRCNPNPCEHGGLCTQTADEFTCACTGTGYAGAVCHTCEEANFQPFAWWVSRGGQRMDYWAGATPGSRMCACGVLGSCVDPAKWCNCDAEYTSQRTDEFQVDGGDIVEKEFLPVKQVRFGDTGSHLDEKEGRYTLGPLLCEGDDLFSNAVTFRIADAVIALPNFDLGHSGPSRLHKAIDNWWRSAAIPVPKIGVNLRPNSMVKYDFLGSWRSTISEHIRVGFTTTNPKGFLLGFTSDISGEYLTLMLSNSGHLRVVFDFGFERQEIIFQGKHFGLGQYHDVRLSRKNGGATMVLQVDNYETQEYNFNIRESADAQFNNIQYMYIGRNESMHEGFAGCEDFCGVEPVTHPPEPVETRPPPRTDLDAELDYHRTDEAILATVLAFIFLLLIIVAVVLVRSLSRHKGEYLTQNHFAITNITTNESTSTKAYFITYAVLHKHNCVVAETIPFIDLGTRTALILFFLLITVVIEKV